MGIIYNYGAAVAGFIDLIEVSTPRDARSFFANLSARAKADADFRQHLSAFEESDDYFHCRCKHYFKDAA